ncbi:rho guanine nucleotide exchange factor 5 [Suncus etruscus]|uniref:rho guanine nucleotide exchange factor 5 n=1 Tax=Suncus etruscus TaxID=109475 RepID=UPI0021104653|nr:rho guanine nucleotide exchange factor 5 [Suncus etruscus]
MAAEEPQPGVSTPIPAREEFCINPEALLRSSQMPDWTPETQESQDLSNLWAESHSFWESQQTDLKHVADDTTESPSPLPTKAVADTSATLNNPVTEACDAKSKSRPVTPQQPCSCPLQTEHLLVVPGSREPSSGVDVRLRPELSSVTLGAGLTEEETSVDVCTQTSSLQASEELPAETYPAGEQQDIERESQSRGQEGHVGPWESQEPQVREGIIGEICSSDLGDQGHMGEQVQKMQIEDGRFPEVGKRLGSEDQSLLDSDGSWEGGQCRDHRNLEQVKQKRDVKVLEGQEDLWSEKETRAQTQELKEKKRSVECQGKGAGWIEDGSGTGDTLQEVEDGTSKDGETDGPTAQALVAPELSPKHPTARIPEAQTEPRAAQLSPGGQPAQQKTPGWPHQHLLSIEDSADQDRAQDNELEESESDQGTMYSPGVAAISVANSESPPETAVASSPVDMSSRASASPQLLDPRWEPYPAALSTETSRPSLSHANPPPSGVSATPSVASHGLSYTEAPLDICPSPCRTCPQSSLANGSGTGQHMQNNSFPSSHRPLPDLVETTFSSSHSELLQIPPKSATCQSADSNVDRKRDSSSISESIAGQHAPDNTPDPDKHHHSQLPSSPWTGESQGPCPGSLPWRKQTGIFLQLPPPPNRPHQPALLTLGPPKGPLPPIPDPLVARQLRPLPSTPDSHHHAQTPSPRLRYNKPLPPTPDIAQPHSSSSPRTYKPLPPIPIMDSSSEPPPLPPKTRGRSKSTQGAPSHSGIQTNERPIRHDWTVSASHSIERTSWPPATGRSSDALAATGRTRSKVTSGLAFSNMTNLTRPSSPTSTRTQKQQFLTPDPGPLSQNKLVMIQQSANGLQTKCSSQTRQPEKLGHPHLEKASSWPHRREPRKPVEANSGHAVIPGDGTSKHKGWNRQGLRRPSILPEGSSDTRSPVLEKFPGPSDAIVFREKKTKDVKGAFARRCSKLINSSQLLYQEYSDVVLNKEIQSQQRLDSIAEEPRPASPRQRQRASVSPEPSLQRLSMVSSASLWQEIPMVRNSTVLLSMTHEDQKLQEAKFELIVSEASYLRSLHIAVDHFQLSTQLRTTLSNQDHQWLFSRLQDVRDVSTMFLSDLEENFENNIFTFQVCDVVLSHAPNFRRVYLPYVTNQTYQERTFQNLLNSNSNFREVLEKLESDPVCQRLSLKSFLILPFQRITRLKLLLQNILKRTQPGSSEEAEATKAHHALEELIRDCNENVRKMRQTEELIYLSQKIEFECKIFPLISQSRWLVKSGELTALEFSVSPGLRRKLNTRPVYLHLFNDYLLLSRPREGGRFLVFDHAPFSSYRGEKCEMKLHGQHKNLFRLFLRHNQGAQSEFLFSTETQSEKLRWISALAIPREELDLLECYDSPQVQCLRAYKPRENDELALEKADVVMVTQQSSDGWLEGMRLSDGERGWFPIQQVEFISNPDVWVRNLKEAQRVKMAKLQLVEQQT